MAFTHSPAMFGLFSKHAFLWILSAGLIVTFGFFAMLPAADIAVSRLFFDQGTCGDILLCGGFPGASSPALAALRSIFYPAPYIIFFGILLFNAAVFYKHKISQWRDFGVAATIFASIAIGPGLLVNLMLKEYVQRSRPRDVLLFGGDFPFVPVGQLEGFCATNCSFVSGEASIAPFMVLSVLLFPKPWQKPALWVLLPASFAMALLRVVVGAHYISDVILGYGLSLLVFSILALAVTYFSGRGQLINQKSA